MSDGREFRAPMVLSDAGAANTFERLLPSDLPALNSLRGQLRRLPPSNAHVGLYVGLSQSDAALGLKGTNLWIYPSFDHDANVERFTRDIDSPFASVYMSFPSAKDPDFQRRYPGKSTVEVITFVPYEAFARLGRDALEAARRGVRRSEDSACRHGCVPNWSGRCPRLSATSPARSCQRRSPLAIS